MIKLVELDKNGIVIGMNKDSLGWQFHWNQSWRWKPCYCCSSYGKDVDDTYCKYRIFIFEVFCFKLWMDLGLI